MSDIVTYWAAFFGVEPAILESPGIWVVPHRMLDGYNGAWLFQHGNTLIVSVPAGDVATTKSASESVLDHLRTPVPHDATALFGTRVERVVGPAYQAYVTSSDFRSVSRPDVRRLTYLELPALERFAAALSAEEWEHASIDAGDEHIFVAMRGAEIIAAANAKEEDGATVLGVGRNDVIIC
jgi:hypothetical protein